MASQGIPFLERNGASKDGFDLPEKQADLRHGVFGVCGNRLAMLPANHELMTRAGEWAVEAQRAKFAEKVA